MGRKNKRKTHPTAPPFNQAEDDKGFGALFKSRRTESLWKSFDHDQFRYATAIGNYRVVMVDAKAGTGKTTIAVMRGIELLREGKVARIEYVRFPDRRGLKLGFEPGGPAEKAKGYMRPFYEAANKCGLSNEDIENLVEGEVFVLSMDVHLRGTNMEDTYLIIDETQNGDITDLRLVLTRIHETGYAVVIGHSGQMDSRLPAYGPEKWNPFQVYQYHMNKKPFVKICPLTVDYRGFISRWADQIDESIAELESRKQG